MSVSKLEKIIFYLFIFAIPLEKRLIVARWTQPFNEWTSAYVYATDILIGALFVLWLVRWLKSSPVMNFPSHGKKFITVIRAPGFWLFMFAAISLLSVSKADIVGLSVYQFLKLAEFVGLFFYLKTNLGVVFQFRILLAMIIGSGVFQAVIGIVQYIKQGGAGLRFLGESPLSVNATGVAVFIVDSAKYLRAYGTMPHPNVLAAWLFIAIFAFYFFYIYYGSNFKKYWFIAYVALLFGFLFTFSRALIGLWAVGVFLRLLIIFLQRDKIANSAIFIRRVTHLVIVSVIVMATFAVLFWPQVASRIQISAKEEAVTQRTFFNEIAGSVAIGHPILGTGIGQFVPEMIAKFRHYPSHLYQPVHNIYLLIASETGFTGLVSFLVFLFLVLYHFVRRTRLGTPYFLSFFILGVSFLVAGLFDHFLWTLQQGSIMLWMILALLSAPNTDPLNERTVDTYF